MTERKAGRRLHINLNVHGTHVAEWLHPDTDLPGFRSFERLSDFTRRAERAGVDAVFFSDGVAYRATGGADSTPPRLDPITLAAGLATQTSRIGFVVTSSTTYNDPYTLARQFASVDHLSHGRIAWNMVTTASTAAAANYGLDAHPDHSDRYRRAGEFVDVVTKLWERSWDADAVTADREAGLFVHPERVHPIDHAGEFFRVAGPLNVTRSPQVRPVLFQAGASTDGLDFAARHAEVVYSISQTLEDARAFYDGLKSRASDLGRDPDQLRIVNGVRILAAPTQAEAEDKFAELESWVDPLSLLRQLSGIIGADLASLALDDPVPVLPPVEEATGMQTHLKLLKGFIERERPTTVRDLVSRYSGVGAPNVTGDPGFVADWLESWYDAGVTDGFNVGFQLNDSGADPFFDLVIPELVRRGLRTKEYTEATLRERYGLPAF